MNIMKRCKTPTRSGIESVDKHRSYTVNLDDRSSDHAEHISDHQVNKTVSNVTVFFYLFRMVQEYKHHRHTRVASPCINLYGNKNLWAETVETLQFRFCFVQL